MIRSLCLIALITTNDLFQGFFTLATLQKLLNVSGYKVVLSIDSGYLHSKMYLKYDKPFQGVEVTNIHIHIQTYTHILTHKLPHLYLTFNLFIYLFVDIADEYCSTDE